MPWQLARRTVQHKNITIIVSEDDPLLQMIEFNSRTNTATMTFKNILSLYSLIKSIRDIVEPGKFIKNEAELSYTLHDISEAYTQEVIKILDPFNQQGLQQIWSSVVPAQKASAEEEARTPKDLPEAARASAETRKATGKQLTFAPDTAENTAEAKPKKERPVIMPPAATGRDRFEDYMRGIRPKGEATPPPPTGVDLDAMLRNLKTDEPGQPRSKPRSKSTRGHKPS